MGAVRLRGQNLDAQMWGLPSGLADSRATCEDQGLQLLTLAADTRWAVRQAYLQVTIVNNVTEARRQLPALWRVGEIPVDFAAIFVYFKIFPQFRL